VELAFDFANDGISGDWGGKAYSDLMKGLDYAEQHYTFIDKTRECTLGAGFGGFMANWILTHTNRFACIVTHDGMFNPESTYGATDSTDAKSVQQWSPIPSIQNAKTPTLVILSQRENRLEVSESQQLYTALQRLNVQSRMLNLPDDFRWQIVDVPAMVREGRRRLPPEVHSLCFFDHVEETEACDALLCSGTLQYVELSIEEVIDRLPQKPYMIFLNKVPVSSKQGFFTVETFVKSLPCHIFGPDDLGRAREHLGYALVASWPIPNRDFVVLSVNGMEKVQMVGEAWVLEQESPKEARDPRLQ